MTYMLPYCLLLLGVPAAIVAINAVDLLTRLLLSPTELVRGCAAIALGYLSHNHAAERKLLKRYILARAYAIGINTLCMYFVYNVHAQA